MSNIIRAKVNTYKPGSAESAIVPVAVPDRPAVRALAERLHAVGRPYSSTHWGWPTQYDPELREDAVEFQIPDGRGGYTTEIRPYWSPASFTIGESGIWFYSLLWENGCDQAPAEFLDDRNIFADAATEW